MKRFIVNKVTYLIIFEMHFIEREREREGEPAILVKVQQKNIHMITCSFPIFWSNIN